MRFIVIISSALRLTKTNFTQQALVPSLVTVYTDSKGEIITKPHKIWKNDDIGNINESIDFRLVS
jgi:hypothetical protein